MNWMTVKEVAAYLKLSEMMIYKLAQNGEMPASKVGSAWRFSEEEIDKWLLKENRFKELWLPEPVASALKDIINDLKVNFKENLTAVILFGSYARGDADKDSDLDLLIVFNSVDHAAKFEKEIDEIIYSNTYVKNRQVLVAPILMSEKDYLTGMSPIHLNIRKEGRRAA